MMFDLGAWAEGIAQDTENSDRLRVAINLNDVEFHATFYNNPSAQAIIAQMPFTLDMSDYGAQEKIAGLTFDLPSASTQVPSHMNTGDIYLYSSNNLVLFYTSFANAYPYVPVGYVEDTAGLVEALGSGNVTVTFSLDRDVSKARDFNFETKTVPLNSGYQMPILGLGTYGLSDEECYRSVIALLESGGRLIDTAHVYGTEKAVGRAVRESGVPREEIFVITKLYPNQFADAEAAIEEALSKLDIDYIDMMLLHHPGANDVTAYQAMEQAVADGKIRSIGLSNWYIEELEAFLPQVAITPALVQNEIHPYYQENDVIPYIHALGIVVQGWYPLGGRGYTAEMLGNETISSIADAHGITSAQVILRWNLQKGVVVIPGSSNPEHIRENLDLFNFSLTEAEMEQINNLDRNEKHDWY